LEVTDETDKDMRIPFDVATQFRRNPTPLEKSFVTPDNSQESH
jgi:hypothetical protein